MSDLDTLLIVDDHAPTRAASVRILRQAGYTVAEAADGAAALDLVRVLRPSLVLLDVGLPDMSGRDVLRTIRADPDLIGVSVVLVSAEQTRPAQQADGLDDGADGYIARPVANTELLARVRLHLRQRDLTSRLRESEARYRTLFEYAPDGILVADEQSIYLDANDAMCRMLGYPRTELIGMCAADIVAPQEVAHVALALEVITARAAYQREWQLQRKDGTTFPADVRATVMPDGTLLAMVRDLTERKRIEQQVLRSQRMESINTLASGLAHDLNNVFAPIILSLDLLAMRFTDDDSRDLLDILATSAHRGADLVRQVQVMATHVEGQRVEVHLEEVLVAVEARIRETFPAHIEVRQHVGGALRSVAGDPGQLYQVLMNLCLNARDAMPKGGVLRLSVDLVQIDAHSGVLNPGVDPGPYVVVHVEDSGTGIASGLMEKIFDPFFTTRQPGQGTGLGLSTAQVIVQSHGGVIRVYSEPGRGTAVKVYLPARTGTTDAVDSTTTRDTPRGSGELIMVVDDEAAVRQITKQTLEAFGYDVVLAADGVDAVAVFASRHGEIAAVLTDMMMPVMDGPATVEALRRIDPAVRVVAASGLAADAHVSRAASLGVSHFLPKPYTAATLLQALSSILCSDRS